MTRHSRAARPVLLDSATGTELARRGVAIDGPSWSAAAIVEAPGVLAAVHRDAIAAGADVVTANTFRTHARNLAPLGLDADSLVGEAVRIARDAAAACDCPVRVAGCVAPLADCYDAAAAPSRDQQRREHDAHAARLQAAGVDVVLVETMTTIGEAVVAIEANRASGRPVWASVAVAADGRLYSGERFGDAIDAMQQAGAEAALANCFPASLGRSLAATLARVARVPWGLQANTGVLNADGIWADDGDTSPAAYATHAADWIAAGASLVGGCCGTTPDHLAAVRETLRFR